MHLDSNHAPYFWAKEGSGVAFLMRDILKTVTPFLTIYDQASVK
jgi:hypothetical protein